LVLKNICQRLGKIQYKFIFLLLFIPLFIIAYPILKPGILLSEDFPVTDSHPFGSNKLSFWIDKGSTSIFEFVSRYPLISLWYIFGLLNVGPDFDTKAMLILGFFIASFSFYSCFYKFFKSRITNSNIQLQSAAILGSLFYAYNVWSFARTSHYYLWLGYAILPLFLISVVYSFKNPRNWKYVIASAVIWSFASTTPHMVTFYGILFAAIASYYILNNFIQKRNLIQSARPFSLAIVLYLLINLYWISPYVFSSLLTSLPAPAPTYVITDSSLQTLSQDSDFLNVFRLKSDWVQKPLPDSELPVTSPFYSLWLVASFVPPIIAFSTLLFKKYRKYTVIFSTMSILGIFLAMGTRAPFDYLTLFFDTHIFSSYGWIFRDPDKWTFLIAVGYSFLIGLASLHILKALQTGKGKKLLPGIFLILLSGSIALYSYPIYKFTVTDKFHPVLIPKEFDEVNGYLSIANPEKVFFIPYRVEDPTTWSGNHYVGDFYELSSVKPSIQVSKPDLGNYYNYFTNSIKDNRTMHIDNFLYPFGASYIIYHNDTLNKEGKLRDSELLNMINVSKGIKNVKEIGFFKIFKTDNNIGQFNVFKQNLAIIGGLDKLGTLNSLGEFSSINSSVFFLDQAFLKNKNQFLVNLANNNPLILGRSSDDLLLSFVDDKYIGAPFGATIADEPSKRWSRAAANDPLHGEFHPSLEHLGINNWDFDYGKGLVLTKALGQKLNTTIEIDTTDNYSLFVRYLKNQKGGILRIYVDTKLVDQINTKDNNLNEFVWDRIDSLNLTKGRHTLTLENAYGFNAVNIFAFIPEHEIHNIEEGVDTLANKTRNVYLIEGESDFHNKGNEVDKVYQLFDSAKNETSGHKMIKGQLHIPKNTSLVSLRFQANQNPHSSSSYTLDGLEISPPNAKDNLFTSNFETRERNENYFSLAKLRQSDWINEDEETQSISRELNNPLSGNGSLRVDVKQGSSTDRYTNPPWSIISTNFIPVADDAHYEYNLTVSAQNVKSLHPKVEYYDLDQRKIDDEPMAEGVSGSFENKYTNTFLPPLGTKYVKLQVWTRTNPDIVSMYLLDNVNLEQVNPSTIFKDNFNSFENVAPPAEKVIPNRHLTKRVLEKGDSVDSNILQTEPIPVKESSVYNYTLSVNMKNMNSLKAYAIFGTSGGAQESAIEGGLASNGRVLTLNPGSELFTKIDIRRPSNYTVALRVKTCETCTFMNVSLGNKTNELSLKDNSSKLKWVYINGTYLQQGENKLKIYSDSDTELDSVVIYSSNKTNETLQDVFVPKEAPATIGNYKKLDPTKYLVKINATKPFMLAFAEAYDPLWEAHSPGFKTNSVPLYSITNGFYINKTGEYTLTIEYSPQKWFVYGAIVSIITVIAISVGIFMNQKPKRIIEFHGLLKIFARYLRIPWSNGIGKKKDQEA
jgi:hypothetical protein